MQQDVQKGRDSREHAVVLLARLAGAGIMAGVLVAFIALPMVGSAGLAARDASNNFENMPINISTSPPPEKTVVSAADGSTLATFFDEYRESVRLDQVAPIMRKAIIAIEDSRFYQHGALDLKGAIRALATNAEANEVRQGGSTLTQQYVKNLLIEHAKTPEEQRAARAQTVGRKLRELRYALHVEQTMSKDEILQGYLNVAYFGGGAYGVQAAAKRYFSKPAEKLNLQEAALLAGITNSPFAYDPTIHPGAARDRRNVVLARMAQLGVVSKKAADKAAASPVKLHETKPSGGCDASKAPFFCTYIRNEMINILSGGKRSQYASATQQLQRGGYTIRTTLDWQSQRAAQEALDDRVGPRASRDAAETMIEPGTGKILAMAVNRDFGSKKKKRQTVLNLAANSLHGGGGGYSAGSTFKIFTLAAAIKEGIAVGTPIKSPNKVSVSGFTDCKGRPLAEWSPRNAGDSEAGTFNLRTGTWHSVNTFYAQLEKRVGVCEAVKMAEAFGMRQSNGTPLQQVPSQVLGTNLIDVTSLAAAYAGFAARGKYCPPLAITEVKDANGKELRLPKHECRQALDEDIADEVNDILRGVLTKGTAHGQGIGRPAAGKTGTCEEFTCALFAGYTPNLAAAVWYGDAEKPWKRKVYGVYGATIPAPIWRQSMIGALSGKPVVDFNEPADRFGDVREIRIPDVQGLSLVIARLELKAAGFDVEISPRPVRSNQPRGSVAFTSPRGGEQAEDGSTVTIFLSDGRGDRGGGNNEPPFFRPGRGGGGGGN
ncbi:MAG TPA: transglycosylase domain-containing protein [Streptosporangiaceae bacterium]|nr:transglycosylase domain-containing protein [Streptosporangiaceae bacterium]